MILRLLAVVGWVCAVASPVTTAAAEARPDLRLGHFPTLTHAQALYARATGRLESATPEITVEWSAFHAGPSAIEALFGGAIDAAFIGPNPALNGFVRSRGEKVVVVAGAASGGAGLVLRGASGIRGERDFDGKIIATPQLGNTQDVSAREWFRRQGYRFRDRGGSLTLIPLSNADQITLFRRGQLDGAWTVEPWLSRLEIEAGGTLFLDERVLWPAGRYATTVLVVDRAYLAAHPDRVETLVRVLVEVTLTVNADRRAAARVLNAELRRQTGQSLAEEVVDRALGRLELTWDPILSSFRRYAEAAHAAGFLKQVPDLRGVSDLRPLNRVLESKQIPTVQE